MKHTNFFQALQSAFSGVRSLFIESRNARIQFILFTVACVLGIYLKISKDDWLHLLFMSILVLALEAVNTSIEELADLHSKAFHPRIKILKDIAAGAVLLACLGAVIVGLTIFFPPLRALLSI